ncbi:MAG: M1 family aminopeptidase [Chloroflexota bacterium]
MKNLFVILIFAALASTFATELIPTPGLREDESFHREEFSKLLSKKIRQGDAMLGSTERSYLNVLTYDLYLDWRAPLASNDDPSKPEVRSWFGRNSIKFKVTETRVNAVEFDCDSTTLKVNSVVAADGPLTFRQTSDALIVTVDETNTDLKDREFSIDVNYEYIGKDNGGFFLYPKGQFVGFGPGPARDSVIVEERLAYTMGEPQDARSWMPCNDRPSDKANARITVAVPEGFTVASNGKLMNIKTLENNAKEYHWSDTTQITTYLMSATASIYKEFSDWYHPASRPGDSIEIKYYVWANDDTTTATNGQHYNASYSFRQVPKMMDVYSKKYVEYPFVKYGMAAVLPFGFGGMEHQTMTTITRTWLRGWYETGIAHELAHQWLGDMVTCATWNDVWINEGGATFSEAVWLDSQYGDEYYFGSLNRNASMYLETPSEHYTAIYHAADIPNAAFSSDRYKLVYFKSGFFYHMLKNLLGEETFYKGLRNLLTNHAFSSITTEDFKKEFENAAENPPVSVEDFIQEWIYSPGHPIYKIKLLNNKVQENSYQVNVTLNQIQSAQDMLNVFKNPVDLMFFKEGVVAEYQRVINNERSQTFTFDFNFAPDSVLINDGLLICEVKEKTVSVGMDKSIASAALSPNPVRTGESFTIEFMAEPGEARFEIIDASGRLVKSYAQNYSAPGAYTFEAATGELAPGAYFVKILSGGSLSFAKLIVI